MSQGQQLSFVLAGMGFFPSDAPEHDHHANAPEPIETKTPESDDRKKRDYRLWPAALLACAAACLLHHCGREVSSSSYPNGCGNSFSLRDLNLTHSLNLSTTTTPVVHQGVLGRLALLLPRRNGRRHAGQGHGIILIRKDLYSMDRLERCRGSVQTGFQNDVLHLGSMMNDVGSNVKKVQYLGSLWEDTKQNAALSFLMSPASKGKDPSDWVLASLHEALQSTCSSYTATTPTFMHGDLLVPRRVCTLLQRSATIGSKMRLANLLHDSQHGFTDMDIPSLNYDDDSISSYKVVIVANDAAEAMSVYERLGILKEGTVVVFVITLGGSRGLPEMARPFLQCRDGRCCWILKV